MNTAEMLGILRTAVRRDIDVSIDLVDTALAYLAENVSHHCAPPKDGGRGERTRFVLFCVLGLSWWPERLHDEHYAAIDWGLGWLQRHLVKHGDGLPEVAGIEDASLFQNATAMAAMAQVSKLDRVQRRHRAALTEVAGVCARGTLYHVRTNGSWPAQAYGAGRSSPTKTALAITGLTDLHAAGLIDDVVAVGGADRERSVALRDLIDSAATWLIDDADRWRKKIAADPEVTGTQWHHLAYAVCLEALVRAGRSSDVAVVPAWGDLVRSWDPGTVSWREFTDPPLPTLRANYWAVRALDAVVDRRGTQGMEDLLRRINEPTEAPERFELVISPLGHILLQPTEDAADRIRLELTAKETQLVNALITDTTPTPVQPEELAERMGIGPGSVGKYVQRLNKTVERQTAHGEPLVVSRRGHGYRLNVQRVRRDDTLMEP